MEYISLPFLNCILIISILDYHSTLFLNISFFKFIIMLIFISIEDVRPRFHYQLPSARPPSATCSKLPVQCALLYKCALLYSAMCSALCTSATSLLQAPSAMRSALYCNALCFALCIAFWTLCCVLNFVLHVRFHLVLHFALHLGLYTVFWIMHFSLSTAFLTALISEQLCTLTFSSNIYHP